MAATDVRERENIPFNRLKRELEDNEEKEGQVSYFYCTPCRSCRKLTLFQIDFLLEGGGHANVQSVKRFVFIISSSNALSLYSLSLSISLFPLHLSLALSTPYPTDMFAFRSHAVSLVPHILLSLAQRNLPYLAFSLFLSHTPFSLFLSLQFL